VIIDVITHVAQDIDRQAGPKRVENAL
jgi:hypothetical protein